MKKIDKFADKLNWVNYIGKEIEKHSGKPFKSGDKIAIPISIETNPYSGKEGFKLGDNTIVDCNKFTLHTIYNSIIADIIVSFLSGHFVLIYVLYYLLCL